MDGISRVIDARGIMAPLPILDLRRALDAVHSGESVEIVSDDEAMAGDIALFLSAAGHELESTENEDSAVKFRIRKA